MQKKARRKTSKPIEITTQIKNQELVEKRREQLVKAASKNFIEKGYDKTSMRDICRDSGLSMGNLYDYISRKEEILYLVHQTMIHNIYDNFFDLKDDDYEKKYAEIPSIIEKALEASLEFSNDIILLYRESGALSKDLLEPILSLEMQYITVFKKLLDKAVEKGLYDIEDTYFVANMIVYLMSFLALRRWCFDDYDNKQEVKLLMQYIKKILNSKTVKTNKNEND